MGVSDDVGSVSRDWDSIFATALADVLSRGHEVSGGPGLSIGSGRTTRELLNYSFELSDPRDRLLFRPGGTIDIVAATGRFAWMMSGSNRLADIEYYDHGARKFSDDGWTVPGSCDGARLLNPSPGMNQLERVLDLLRTESGTRRAVAAIYRPEDAGRRSRDIPCAIAVAYNVRGGEVHATTILRSSNAFRILPYDVFLFSLLAEVVAAELGMRLATYHQFAVSLHIYDKDIEAARDLVSSAASLERTPMPPMPRGTALRDVKVLAEIEQDLRASHLVADSAWMKRFDVRIEAGLPRFWQNLARLLLIHALRMGSRDAMSRRALEDAVAEQLDEPFKGILRQTAERR
jgi:hypothetical protein